MAIRPPILRAGDTVGVVTLGSPRDEATINARIQFLENLGFNVVVGNYVYSWAGYVAATPQQRASDLMSMFENPDVRAIIPARGGTGVADILPYLDYNFISQNPKIITGYSDITVLLNVLYILSNLITFHSLLLIVFYGHINIDFTAPIGKSSWNSTGEQGSWKCNRCHSRRKPHIIC